MWLFNGATTREQLSLKGENASAFFMILIEM